MKTPPPPPIRAYLRYGDQRPPVRVLESGLEETSDSQQFDDRLARADMQIDLAMHDANNANRYLRKANSGLLELIHDIDPNFGKPKAERGRKRKLNSVQRQTIMRAVLGIAELPNWQRAAHGQAITNDYHGLLRAAAIANLYNNGPATEELLMESMPVLLGARAITRQIGIGWTGRLALRREDKRLRASSEKGNPNWDCGISFSYEPADFDQPAVKIQTKRSGGSRPGIKRTDYARSGVTCLNARQCGFDNPGIIISSCLKEINPSIPIQSAKRDILSPDGLDGITWQADLAIVKGVRLVQATAAQLQAA
jgi:hypothetical protein